MRTMICTIAKTLSQKKPTPFNPRNTTKLHCSTNAKNIVRTRKSLSQQTNGCHYKQRISQLQNSAQKTWKSRRHFRQVLSKTRKRLLGCGVWRNLEGEKGERTKNMRFSKPFHPTCFSFLFLLFSLLRSYSALKASNHLL